MLTAISVSFLLGKRTWFFSFIFRPVQLLRVKLSKMPAPHWGLVTCQVQSFGLETQNFSLQTGSDTSQGISPTAQYQEGGGRDRVIWHSSSCSPEPVTSPYRPRWEDIRTWSILGSRGMTPMVIKTHLSCNTKNQTSEWELGSNGPKKNWVCVVHGW